MTSLVDFILVIFVCVCDSCDSWAERVVEEIFNNMSSILMFHRIFAAVYNFLCKLLDTLLLGIPIFGWKCFKKKTLHQLVVFLAVHGGKQQQKLDGSVSTTLL